MEHELPTEETPERLVAGGQGRPDWSAGDAIWFMFGCALIGGGLLGFALAVFLGV